PVQRKQPPGMSQKEFADKLKAINDAIAKNDIGAMRQLAKDGKAMAVATSDEKAAIVKALSEECKKLAGKKELICTNMGIAGLQIEDQVPKRRDADRDAVNNILKSAGNSEGYGEIMKQADPELVKEGMTAGIKEPAKDTRVVDFNLIAGTF